MSEKRTCDWCGEKAIESFTLGRSAVKIEACPAHRETARRASEGFRSALVDGSLADEFEKRWNTTPAARAVRGRAGEQRGGGR